MSVAKAAMKGVTYYSRLKADNGYTLFNPIGATDVLLIDMEGYIVHRWCLTSEPSLHGVLLPNGNLMYAGLTKSMEELHLPMDFRAIGGEIVEMDWYGNVLWKAEVPYQHHDFLPLPNGHVMYPTHLNPGSDLPDELASRWKGGRLGSEYNGKIWGDEIFEIDRNGNMVWEWKSYEHLDPEIDALSPLEDRTHWHINSLWLCRDGGILVSARSLSEVFKIEYPSGKVIGRYGRGKISTQHDARELDNGNILIFDNGSHRPGYVPGYSRSVEIDPNTDEIVWEYKADPPYGFYSSVMGGNERLPNGNTLICESCSGTLFEVTGNGELAWEYVCPIVSEKGRAGIRGNWIFRGHRYSRDYPGLKGKDLDPRRFPWENQMFGPDAFKKDFSPLIF